MSPHKRALNKHRLLHVGILIGFSTLSGCLEIADVQTVRQGSSDVEICNGIDDDGNGYTDDNVQDWLPGQELNCSGDTYENGCPMFEKFCINGAPQCVEASEQCQSDGSSSSAFDWGWPSYEPIDPGTDPTDPGTNPDPDPLPDPDPGPIDEPVDCKAQAEQNCDGRNDPSCACRINEYLICEGYTGDGGFGYGAVCPEDIPQHYACAPSCDPGFTDLGIVNGPQCNNWACCLLMPDQPPPQAPVCN
ncbi:MAG: hypothetical protein IPJ88_09810 [Myxococcales bacterium]|nr:MAG: hypothetical protein IPJ88_09810 [Myxococcales bacterium]